MVLNEKDYTAIDAAAAEFFKEQNVQQKCPRCSGVMVVDVQANSYEVRCENGCISERFRGI